MDQKSNVRRGIIILKAHHRKHGGNICNLGFSNGFLDITLKAQATKLNLY